jgi:hypothetical protein
VDAGGIRVRDEITTRGAVKPTCLSRGVAVLLVLPSGGPARGQPDWWVKERQEWWGRVRGRDSRQRWIRAADIRAKSE